MAAPAEGYFGDEGLYCNGEYMPWLLSGQYLVQAKVMSDITGEQRAGAESATGEVGGTVSESGAEAGFWAFVMLRPLHELQSERAQA